MQAGRDRTEGKFDEWKEAEREQYWGKREPAVQDENVDVTVKAEQGNEKAVKESQSDDGL